MTITVSLRGTAICSLATEFAVIPFHGHCQVEMCDVILAIHQTPQMLKRNQFEELSQHAIARARPEYFAEANHRFLIPTYRILHRSLHLVSISVALQQYKNGCARFLVHSTHLTSLLWPSVSGKILPQWITASTAWSRGSFVHVAHLYSTRKVSSPFGHKFTA